MKKYKSLLSTILAAVFLFTSIFVQYGTAFAENKNDENSKLYKEIQAQKAIPEASREVKELSAKVYGVMKLKDKYSKMDDEEKKLVESYFNVRGDVLEKCEERGYSLVDSINRGAISIRYDLTLDEVEQLLSAKGNIQNLAAEFAKYKSLVEKYNFSDTEAIEARELILQGFSVDGLRDAYIVSRALGINIKEIAFKADGSAPSKSNDAEKSRKTSENGADIAYETHGINEMDADEMKKITEKYGSDNASKIKEMRGRYKIDVKRLLKYMEDNNLDAKQVEDKILEYQVESGDGIGILSVPEDPVSYDKYLTAPYSYRGNAAENVNLNTGSLTYETTDLLLPGRNGLDLIIVSRYESDKANLYEAGYRIESELIEYIDYDYEVWSGCNGYEVDPYGNYTLLDFPYTQSYVYRTTYETYSEALQAYYYWSEDVYYEDYFGEGYDLYRDWYAGIYEVIDYGSSYSYWTYNYINETKPNTYTELHNNLGCGWSLGFSSIEINNGKKYLHLANGNSYEINITSTAGDSNLKNYTLNDIRLENDSGTFTNGVKNSQYVLFYKNGNREYFADDGRLLGIQDRFGNTIKFEHTTINNHPVINKITDSVNRVVNISYETTSTGKKVVITAPDSTTIQYMLEPISGYSGEYKLVKKIDRLGRETVFNYSINNGNFSFFSKSNRNTANYFASLTEIYYPTGAYTKYTYESTAGNLGNQGSYVYYRIKTREDIENSVSNKKDTYTYSGNYTGYPSYSDPASLPSEFTYGTTVTDNENLQSIYTFNNKHLKTREETKDGTTQINITDYEYDANKLPVKVVRKDYGKTAGQYMLKVENFAYDTGNFGDLTGYWDTRSERDANNMPLNDEHKTTYVYNSTYHYVTEKTYKKDAATTIKEEYIPYSDNKKVEWFKVKENEVLKKQSWYDYDSYGNVIEERSYLDDWVNYISQKYSYDDNDPGRNGQLNGAYLTRKWVEGVKDADGALVEARPGNSPGVIDETYKYNIIGLVVEKTDEVGNITSYEYDNLGRIKKEIHPDSTYREYTYNDAENSITVKDENGKQMKYDYDGFGNLSYEQDMTEGQVTREYTYDQKFRIKSEKTKSKAGYNNESTVWYTYYKDGRLSKKEIKDSSGTTIYTENYEYDDAYNNGQYARTTKTIVGDSTSPSIITHTYEDRNGQVVKEGRMNDAQELIETFEYDYLGNRISERNARAYSEGWPETWTARYEYDYAGRVTRTYNIAGDYTTTEYDALGRVKAVTDIKGNKAAEPYSTLYFYDSLGRLIEERVPFEDIGGTIYYSIKKYYYDRNGNVVLEKESKNKPGEAISYNHTAYEYNNRNMLTKVITYDGGSPENYTQYYYDGVGNKLRMYTGLSSPLTITGLDNVTSGSDNDYSVTKYEYDQFNRLIKMTDPLGRYETYTYDYNGDLRQKADRNGSIIEMEYTALGKLSRKTVTNADEPSMNVFHEYTYSLTGNVVSIEVSTGESQSLVQSTDFTYDSLGRLLSETVTDTQGTIVKTYGYDANDNKTSFILTVGSSQEQNIIYQYDKQDRLWKVFEGGQTTTPTAVYAYDDNGNRSSLEYSNGNSALYQYNLANKLKEVTNKRGATTLSQYTYNYYLNGNWSDELETVANKLTEYTYDGLGRLVTETEKEDGVTTSVVSYTYDDYNNRSTMAISGGTTTTYTYDKNNRLITETRAAGDVTETTRYGYDYNGNMIYKGTETLEPSGGSGESVAVYISGEDAGSGNVTLNEYDGLNQLIKTTVGDKSVTYAYNVDGLRIYKTVNDTIARYTWSGNQIVMELDGEGAVTAKYIRGINLIATEGASGENRKYYLFNGHGDVIQLTGTDGNVSKIYDYDAFGNEKNPDDADTNPFRYCGEYFDKETRTYYLRARYYDPATGRFISEDSVWGQDNDPLSLNLYTYAHNNPIMYYDPDGRAINLITAGVGAGIGAIINVSITFARDFIEDRQINKSWKEYAGSAASGAIGGATAGFTMGGSLVVQVIGHTAVGAASSAAASVTEQLITKGEVDWESVGYSAISGGVSAGAAKGLSGLWSKVKGVSKISTPYGDAMQEFSEDALKVKKYVQGGGEIYRGGKFGRSNTIDAQFWAPVSPYAPRYADNYGVDFDTLDYIIGGKLKNGQLFITRTAPGLGNNVGGAIEVVTNQNAVKLDFFHMP